MTNVHLRWLLRHFARFDYDAEIAYALDRAEDLPMVELVPSKEEA